MNDAADLDPEDAERLGTEPTRSSRDPAVLQERLERWLQGVVADPAARVGPIDVPSGSGMSSETLLFDARWTDDAGPHDEALVARVEPAAEDVPVFPDYDLELQFRLLRLVAQHSDVPVPVARWLEQDEQHLGSPFFVMNRVTGRVPADIPPYVFEGWLLDADEADQRALQDHSVAVLAALHDIDIADLDVTFLHSRAPGDSALRQQMNHQRWFYDWTRGERRHPIVDTAFEWLETNWPEESPSVISWGDARIGNIMYTPGGFDPVAVFDWEMATIGPAELDVGWMIFLHSFFQNIAEVLGLGGMPSFMRRADVAATYEARRGVRLRDLHWYEVFAATRHAIIMSRIRDRQVRFGEAEWPDDVDEAIPHRELLRSMLETGAETT